MRLQALTLKRNSTNCLRTPPPKKKKKKILLIRVNEGMFEGIFYIFFGVLKQRVVVAPELGAAESSGPACDHIVLSIRVCMLITSAERV